MVHEYFLYIYHEGHIICIDIINLNFFGIFIKVYHLLVFATYFLFFFIFNCTQRKEDASLKFAINRILDRRIPVSLLTGIPPPHPPDIKQLFFRAMSTDFALPVCCLNLASVCLCQQPIFHYFHSFDVFYLFCFVQKAKGILGQIYLIGV